MCTCITTCNVQCAVKVIVANGNCSTSHGPTTREHTMAQLLSLDITLLHPLTYDSSFSTPNDTKKERNILRKSRQKPN